MGRDQTSSTDLKQFYTNDVKVKLPEHLTGEWYITTWTDAFDVVHEDTLADYANPDIPENQREFDNNNYKASNPITLLLTPPPDLEVTAITPLTAAPKAGEAFSVSWTVENKGGTSAVGSWVDTVYLSDKPTLEGAKLWKLGSVTRTVTNANPLEQYSTYQGRLDTVLAPSAQGQYLIIKTNSDTNTKLWEGTYTTNNQQFLAAPITATPADLVVKSVDVLQPNVFSGELTKIRWTVENQGSEVWAGTRYWYDEVWVSPNATFDSSQATKVGFFLHNATQPLQPGGTYTQEQSIRLPAGIEGSHFVHVSTNRSYDSFTRKYSGELPAQGDNDQSRQSFEYRVFENPNNNLGQAQTQVIYQEPDLTVSNHSLSESSVSSGQSFRLNWTVSNQGNRDTRENAWVDRVYLSQDGSLDSDDRLLGEYIHRGILKQGLSYHRSETITLPDGISGSYQLLVFTDSNFHQKYASNPTLDFEFLDPRTTHVPEFRDEGNNLHKIPLPITLTPPPDLQVTQVQIPGRAIPGQSFSLSYTVTNRGTGATPARQNTWEDRIYLSRDQNLDVRSDVYLGSIPHTGGLGTATNSNSYSINNHTVALPLDPTLTGSFYVYVLTDAPGTRTPGGNVFEGSNEGNNAFASPQPLLLELPPPADLQVDAITFPLTTTQAGAAVTINWTVTNRGENPAIGQWSDAVYLSTDDQWDIGDRLLGRVARPGMATLAPFAPDLASDQIASYSQSLTAMLPGVTPGQYRIIVRPDIYNQVYEADRELNNPQPSANSLSIAANSLQLGVSQQTTLSSGQERLYELEVTQGQTIRIAIDSSMTGTNGGNEVLVGFNKAPTSTDYIAASQGILTPDPTVTIPTTQAGKYYVLVRGQNQPSGTATTIRADALPFGISDVVTDRGGDSRYVTTTIYGAQFDQNAIVKLARPGIEERQPVRYEVIDSTRIVAIFDLTDAPHGLYDVQVTNPNQQVAVLPYRYLVERAIQPDVTVGLGGPGILTPGEAGTYGVSVQSLTNLDTPYVHFQVGMPEKGINSEVFDLPYTVFSSNLRGNPSSSLTDVPWATLVSDINRNGEILAPGYALDLPTGSFVGRTFTIQTYPGLLQRLAQEPNALEDIPDDEIAFRFHILASATALTRNEFIAAQTQEALRLRAAVLADATASTALVNLAADESAWVSSYLAALEDAGLLRPDDQAPPIRQQTQVISTVATLATGLLLGHAGEQIRSSGDLTTFFEQVRRWYGHTPNQIGSDNIPDLNAFDLGATQRTHTQAFNIFVPYGEARLELPPSVTVPPPSFSSFLNSAGSTSSQVSLIGPLGAGTQNTVPRQTPLPYTVRFENAATNTDSVNEVRIVTQLDSDLDPRTFRLGGLRLGDIEVNIPNGQGSFQGDFDFVRSKGFVLRVSAGLDPVNNVATWLLQAIDPRTGEVLQDRDAGLLLPNTTEGDGAGFVSYTIQAQTTGSSGTEISSEARVFFDGAAPLDTNQVRNILDAAAPTTALTTTALGHDLYQVEWQAVDDAMGSGVKHVTVYVAEDGGDFTIWQRQTTETSGVFTGRAGHTYEFLALATDEAGNQEQPRLGIAAPNDGSTVNLGTLPTVETSGGASSFNPAPAPSSNTSPNALFREAERAIPAIAPTTAQSEFDRVLRPFTAQSFATGIGEPQTNPAEISAMAIATLPDGSVLLSGGANRGSLYRVPAAGGAVGNPVATLNHPIFDLAVDQNGSIWAATGGGPLLQLNAQGQIVKQYGDGITQSVAIDPASGKLFVSSSQGIEIFDPIRETFTHFSDQRVGNLAFNPADGTLWAATWPVRGDVLRFDPITGVAERMLHFDAPVDSIAFGQGDTKLQGLLFVSTNDNPETATQNDGDLILVDLATLRQVKVALGGSRGDIVKTTADGRVLISQSNQVDVLSPILAPKVAYTDPAPDAIVALPDGDLSITFDQDMFVGSGTEAHSVLNPVNYTLIGQTTGQRAIHNIVYDPSTRSVRLEFNALDADHYEIGVAPTLRSAAGMDLEGYTEQFTAISDFLPYVDIQFTNPRSDRHSQTVSFDVTLTNTAEYDLQLPLVLLLDPAQAFTGQFQGTTQTSKGVYLLDLSSSLPDGRLSVGESIISRTITVYNPDALRVEFAPGIYAMPYPNQAPIVTSAPVTQAIAGQSYHYTVSATDPDGSTLGYVLTEAPDGMAIDAKTGAIVWSPTVQSPVNAEVAVRVYDTRGGFTTQSFSVQVAGGNDKPVFAPIASQLNGREGQPLQMTVNASDRNTQALNYWVEDLPPGASFDAKTRTLSWTPGFEAAGTYNVTFVVSDGIETVRQASTILIAPTNQAPTLIRPADITVREGETIRLNLPATDPEGKPLTYSSNLLPGGARLDPRTGEFEWTPTYFQAGTFKIPFSVSDGAAITTQKTKITVTNVNAAPVFENLERWTVQEGQEIRFRSFAFDPDNPSFIPQERAADGRLTILEGSNPSVTYSISGLPAGASFDAETAMFTWRPGFTSAGTYAVTFTATDNGNGTGVSQVTTQTIPITVLNTNNQPQIEPIGNPAINAGETQDIVIRATDVDGNPLSFSLTQQGGVALPDFIELTDNGNGTATLHLAPTNQDGGNYTLTVTATDNGDGSGAALSNSYSFVVAVKAPNPAPQLGFLSDRIALIGQPLSFEVNASDRSATAANQPITYSINGLPNAAIVPSSTYGKATVNWMPSGAGTYPVTISVTDAEGLTTQQLFQVSARDANQAPVLQTIAPQTVAEGQRLSLQLMATDTNGDRLSYTAKNLPEGAVLDAATGQLTWTPTLWQAGVYRNIELTATDGNLSHTQTVTIEVTNTNQAPRLTALPLQMGTENQLLQLTLSTSDGDGETPLLMPLTALPTGAAFDRRTGQLRWTPSFDQAGEYTWRFEAKDAAGATAFTDVQVRIANVNRAPSIAVSNHAIALGETMQFTLSGQDADAGTSLIYSADQLPTGAVLDAQTGELRWQPSPGQTGEYVVNFTVSDGQLTATEATVIKVATTIAAPTVTIDLTPSFPAVPGQRVQVQTIADSFASITQQTLSINGQPIAIDAGGRGQWIAATPGRFAVEATATDADGRIGRSNTIVKVRDVNDVAAPVVSFAPGINGSLLTSATSLTGTISDSNLDLWRLEIADFGESTFRTLAQGHASTNGVLGAIDPGTLTNGFYQLRLSATDISGRTSMTEAIVEINSAVKPSQYLNAQSDLSLTLGGIDLNLVRTYDSLNADETGLFGAGWHLTNLESQIQTNVPLTGSEATGVYNPFRQGTRLYLTAPAGERIGFTFAPQKHEIAGLTYYTPAWVADAGVNYTLHSADAMLSKQGERFFDLASARPYNPASGAFEGADYTLIAADGTRYDLSATEGLQRQQTTSGVSLFYSDSGIVSSTGESISFVKDAEGRLTQITATDGTILSYGYQQGNLVSARNLAAGTTQRFGYQDNRLVLMTAKPGEPGQAIQYGAGAAQVLPIIEDLGSAAQFTGKTTTGGLNAGEIERYTFSLRPDELQSTATGTVLIGVSLQNSTSLPEIGGFAPVTTQIDANGAFALYAINRTGLHLIESAVNGQGGLNLSVAGDINTDGFVNGVDSQLMMNAIGGSYDLRYDLNRDGAINATDIQILGSNFGFTANRAPVVTSTTTLTHEDLEVTIPLDKLASDPEGDAISYRFTNPVNGTVTLTPDGKAVRFIPTADFIGTARFDLIADDGFSSSTATTMTVEVSGAKLINLDFVHRNPKLQVGQQTELVVIGDFADQQDVVLPDSYLTYASNNATVATIGTNGVVTGLSSGTTILSAARDGITAVTISRIGELAAPTNQAQLDVAIAEAYGLNLYPQAVTLTEGIDRQLLVGLNGITDSPDLKFGSTGTRYFVSNPSVLQVNADGLITTLDEGIANVTVVYGASEFVVPVQVETPYLGSASLGTQGGAVQALDGATVMVAPGALAGNTTVSIQQLRQDQLTLAIPEDYSFAGAFQLNMGNDPLNVPVQLAIPAPIGLAAGTEVFFMRQTELPDATGVWKPIWLMEESGVVGTDGMIRTQSPPWEGVRSSGTISIAVPSFNYNVAKAILQNDLYEQGVFYLTAAGVAAPINSRMGLSFGLDALKSFAGAALINPNEQFVDIVEIPKIGTLPFVTREQVQLNPRGIPEILIGSRNLPAAGERNAFAPPILHTAELNFNNGGPVVYVTASNLLNDSNGMGSRFEDVQVNFRVGNQTYQGKVLTGLSTDLGNNLYKVAVRPPETVALGEVSIELVRRQEERVGLGAADLKIVEYESVKDLIFDPRGNNQSIERALVAQVWNDTVTVINALNPENVLAQDDTTSLDLIMARIPVGTDGVQDGPRYLAATSNASRAYVSLGQSGQIAVIDLLMQRQLDTDAVAEGVNPIRLAVPNAKLGAIAIGADDQYAYVADKQIGAIYVIGINPMSQHYNEHIGTIPVDAPNGIRDLAMSSDKRRLFVTAPNSSSSGKGEILVINVDPADRPRTSVANPRLWHRLIGEPIEASFGLEGISAAPTSNQMVFTNRADESKGFGVLTITNDDPLQFAATTKYVALNLGEYNDYFDVNEAVAVTVTGDGKYAFVAGRNSRGFGTNAPSVEGPKAGSNIGIILVLRQN